MSYRFADSLRAGSGRNHPDPAHKLSANLYDIYLLLCIQYYTPDDGQRNCPKRVEFYSKNKFEKLVQLVGFIIGIKKQLFRQSGSVSGIIQYVHCSDCVVVVKCGVCCWQFWRGQWRNCCTKWMSCDLGRSRRSIAEGPHLHVSTAGVLNLFHLLYLASSGLLIFLIPHPHPSVPFCGHDSSFLNHDT